MEKDVFCKIIAGELPGDIVHRDEDFVVVKDLHPKAPVHLLIVPVKHYEALDSFKAEESELLGRLLLLADKVAKEQGLGGKGYRLIMNDGADGGKIVPHLHFHLLGGKNLGPKIIQE